MRRIARRFFFNSPNKADRRTKARLWFHGSIIVEGVHGTRAPTAMKNLHKPLPLARCALVLIRDPLILITSRVKHFLHIQHSTFTPLQYKCLQLGSNEYDILMYSNAKLDRVVPNNTRLRIRYPNVMQDWIGPCQTIRVCVFVFLCSIEFVIINSQHSHKKYF